MTVDPFAQLDAAYSLGALDADDLAAFEAHLHTCAACRARVDELRPTMRLLATSRTTDPIADARPDAVLSDMLLPDTLLPGLLRRAERERARRAWAVRAIAGFAAACLVTLVVVLWPSSSASRSAPQALVALRTSQVNVKATARLVAKPWGTEIDVRCRHELYAGSSGGSFGLRVVDRDRHAYDLGTWSAGSAGTITFTGGTAVRRERIARVQITLPNGTPILQLVL